MDKISKTSLLNEVEQARARSLAYDLFARLFLKEPDADTLERLKAVPDLEQALAEDRDRLGGGPGWEASQHFALFGFNVFPFQSIFLDVEGSLGGQESEQVFQFYQEAGFDLSSLPAAGRLAAGESPDHAGLELAFLSALSQAEADALQAGSPAAGRFRQLQREFMDRHLLPWLPAFVQAVCQQRSAFYSVLAQMTLELVCEHRQDLEPGEGPGTAAFSLPPAPDVLEDKKAGLKEIAEFLLTPAYSGLYISREDIARLGRAFSLPRGFGGRLQMMTNLLRSAVDYDMLAALVEKMLSLLQEWQAGYQEAGSLGSSCGHVAAAWLDRLEKTRGMLVRLAGAAEEHAWK